MWLTNKKTGAKFNTDWIDQDAKVREAQILKNSIEAQNVAENENTSDFTSIKTLSKYEAAIKNEPVEHARIVKGRQIIVADKSDNATNRVMFTAEEIAQFEGATLTHNHPVGATFSTEDLNCLIATKLKEIRAVLKEPNFYGTSGVCVLTKVADNMLASNFARDYAEAEFIYKRDVTTPMWDKHRGQLGGSFVQSYADKLNIMVDDYCRQWLKKNAKYYGYKYSEVKNA